MRRHLLLVAVIFASAVPSAASAPPTISIQSDTRVAEGWQMFQVYGAITGARAGESIAIEAYLCDGYGIWQSQGKTDVASSGTWATNITVPSDAKLRARWRGGVSNTINVQIHPHVLLQPQGPGRFGVSVNANSFFDGKRGVFERLNGTKWIRVRSFKLSAGHFGPVWSTARFRAHVKPGTFVRAVLPRSQVGRCYLAGFSNTIKV